MERYRANIENPELEWETQVIFDDVVKREYERHPELNSRRKKLIFIQETFQLWQPAELGHLLKINESSTRKFLSRRGIRENEYQEIKNQFDAAFVTTSIIERNKNDLISRRSALSATSTIFNGMSIKHALLDGMPEKAVFIAEKSQRHAIDEVNF